MFQSTNQWYIYLHLADFVQANVGKYSSNMEHMEMWIAQPKIWVFPTISNEKTHVNDFSPWKIHENANVMKILHGKLLNSQTIQQAHSYEQWADFP